MITNIFKGKTGHQIANHLDIRSHYQGYEVVLLTSNPKEAIELSNVNHKMTIKPYKTFDELHKLMENEIKNGNYDVIIHSAAVSDYYVEGTYANVIEETWVSGHAGVGYKDSLGSKIDSQTKISSDNDTLYLKLKKTPKIISKIKSEWQFKGLLIGFKLLVGVSDEELIKVATESLNKNNADYIVANCLEWSKERAIIVGKDNVTHIKRDILDQEIEKLLI